MKTYMKNSVSIGEVNYAIARLLLVAIVDGSFHPIAGRNERLDCKCFLFRIRNEIFYECIQQQQPQTDEYRSYFIHRPTDEHGFKVSLEKIKGSWKVVKFEHQETNGYITANYYWPGLKDQWEEVQP
jgi:hypothetical protein